VTAILLARSLLGRPVRTALLLLGFGVGVGVMITLLAVGQAVLDQARNEQLVGGGDVVTLPAGMDLEIVQTGGATAYGFRIEHTRFLVRQLFGGPRFRGRVVAASPLFQDAVVYMRRARTVSPAWQLFATGAVPSADRAARGDAAPPAQLWSDTARDRRYVAPTEAERLAETDALHTPPDSAESWAEWQYVTATSARGDAYVYVSFLAPLGAGGFVSLQVRRPGTTPERYVAIDSVARRGAQDGAADIAIGGSSFHLRGAQYAVHLDFTDAYSGIRVRGDFLLSPARGLYLSPTEVQGESGFVSGYVVPALRASIAGSVRIGNAPPFVLTDFTGYHDHNWGTWAGVHWDWGEMSAPEGALLYGGVSAPALDATNGDAADTRHKRADRAAGVSHTRAGLATHIAALYGADGLLGVFRPDSIAYLGWHRSGATNVPSRVTLTTTAGDDSLDATLEVADVVATPLDLAGATRRAGARDRTQSASREPAAMRVFLQMHGTWRVRGRAGGRVVDVRAPGAAETFVAP
jgi:hypothetical protein